MQQKLCVVVVGIGFISLVLGFLQVAQGPDSSLRFFSITNPSEAVGFFANRNHFAALLYTTLLFSAGLVLPTQTRRVMSDRTGSQIIFRSMMCFAGLIAVVAGLALARSRAGLGLGVLALAMIVATALWRQRARPLHDTGTARVLGRKAPYAMVILALVFAAQFGLQRMLVRFGQDPLDDLRVPLFTQTAQAIADALPWGSGLGSFVHVYAVQEQVEALFGGFANRAHNDVLEILLETGLMGFGLLLCFGVWFLARSIRIWHTDSEPSRQLQLQRAASLVLVLLALHSLVDYPLRTTALATLAAFAAAVMATPTLANTGTDTGTDRLGHNPQTQAQPLHVKPALDPAQLKPRWGKQVNWPKEWTTSDDDKPD